MNKRITLVLAGVMAAAASQANLIINGGFELNSAGGNIDNMSNATWNGLMSNSTAYGASEELDLYNASGTWGPPPCEGLWKVAMHTAAGTTPLDAFTLELSSALVVGTSYNLSFCAVANDVFGSGVGALDLGITTTAGTFGTGVYSTAVATGTTWTVYSTSFVATVAATHLSVSTVAGNGGWNHVDDFNLDVVPEPASMAALGLGAVALIRRRRKA